MLGIVTVPLKRGPISVTSSKVRSSLRLNTTGSEVSQWTGTPIPSRPTSVSPTIALLVTCTCAHGAGNAGSGQSGAGASPIVPSEVPTSVNVTPTLVGTSPASFSDASNGGTLKEPVRVPPQPGVGGVDARFTTPLKVECFGRTTGSPSFFGVRNPDTAWFVSVNVIPANAGAAATDIPPTTAKVAVSATRRRAFCDM